MGRKEKGVKEKYQRDLKRETERERVEEANTPKPKPKATCNPNSYTSSEPTQHTDTRH